MSEALTHTVIERRIAAGDESLLPGWVLLPLRVVDGERRPVAKWAHLTGQSTEDRASLARIDHDGWAVATGPSGLYVVDLDRGHADDVDGIATWVELLGDTGHTEWNPSVIGATPRGGRHLYYANPGDEFLRISLAGLLPGVDVKCRGGMATVSGPARSLTILEWRFPPIPAPLLGILTERARAREEREREARATAAHSPSHTRSRHAPTRNGRRCSERAPA